MRTGYFEVAELFDHYGEEAYADNGLSNGEKDIKINGNGKTKRESPKNSKHKNNSNDGFLKF